MSNEDCELITLLVMEGYKGLAGAIVLQACADYDTAIQKGDKALQGEVESFFRGSWYRMLCDIPGEMVMAKIRESGMAPFRITQREAKTDETKRTNRRRRERRHTDAVHDEYWNTFLAPCGGLDDRNEAAKALFTKFPASDSSKERWRRCATAVDYALSRGPQLPSYVMYFRSDCPTFPGEYNLYKKIGSEYFGYFIKDKR